MPKISVIMPVYNVQDFVGQAIGSVLNQNFEDFELIIVNDCSPDKSIDICRSYHDPRIRIVEHEINQGLAAARNTGIRHARGELLAFLDSDDCWHPSKLAYHVTHLQNNPRVGVSFSRSEFIDQHGNSMSYYQMPQLKGIESNYLLCRNPVGNGSAPVIRRTVFEEIAFTPQDGMQGMPCYFDPALRQSEDIECWIRISLTTDWMIEGIPDALTYYRLNAGGLSANLYKQLASWETVIKRTSEYAPEFIAKWQKRARAYQLRYLARQAIRLRDGATATSLVHNALSEKWTILIEEPGRTIATLSAAYLLKLMPECIYLNVEKWGQQVIGFIQEKKIRQDLEAV